MKRTLIFPVFFFFPLVASVTAADPVDGDISVDSIPGNPGRAILDIPNDAEFGNLGFTISNSAGNSADYSLSGNFLSDFSDFFGGTVSGGGTNSVTGKIDASGLSAGDTRTFTINVDPTTPDLNPVSATHDVQFVNNRQMTWNFVDGGIVSLGRHIAGSQGFDVELSGGAQTRSQATDINLYENGYIYATKTSFVRQTGSPANPFNSNAPYFVKEHTERDVFDGANQKITLTGYLGVDGKSYRSVLVDENLATYSGISLIQSAENLTNEDLQVAGDSIGVFGTAVRSRDMEAGSASLGRVMVGQSGTKSGSRSVNLTTEGSDATTARIYFGGGVDIDNGQGVVAKAGPQVTLNSDQFTTVNLDYNLTYGASGQVLDTSSVGVTGSAVDVDPWIGLELPDQKRPHEIGFNGGVTAGLTLTVVEDRAVAATNRTGSNAFVALDGATVTELKNDISTTNSSPFYTTTIDIVDNNGGAEQGQAVKELKGYIGTHTDTFNPGDLQRGAIGLGQVAHSGSRDFTINPEGLDGENAQASVGYDWDLKFVTEATTSITRQTGTTMVNGDSVTLTHTGNATTSADLIVDYGGGLGVFTLTPTIGDPGNGDRLILDGGDSLGVTVGVAADLSPGTHQSRLRFNLYNDIDFGDTYIGHEYFIMSHTVAGSTIGTTSRGALISGTTFSNLDATLTNDAPGSKGSTVRIIDSLALTEDVGYQISFESADLAEGLTGDEIATDAVDISGLDGQVIVIESTYDEADMIAKWGTEAAAVLTWWDEDAEAWVNAVAGNSDGRIGTRYASSYEDYLTTIGGTLLETSLGDYGFDVENNRVWAVVDHNSSFGGGAAPIPEPSALVLMLLGGGALFCGRRGHRSKS